MVDPVVAIDLFVNLVVKLVVNRIVVVLIIIDCVTFLSSKINL